MLALYCLVPTCIHRGFATLKRRGDIPQDSTVHRTEENA